MAATKKSDEEQIKYLEAKLAKLKAKTKELSKSSEGVDQLLAAIDNVVKQNNCDAIDVIIAVSKFKRLGLTITRPTRKPKKETSSKKSSP